MKQDTKILIIGVLILSCIITIITLFVKCRTDIVTQFQSITHSVLSKQYPATNKSGTIQAHGKILPVNNTINNQSFNANRRLDDIYFELPNELKPRNPTDNIGVIAFMNWHNTPLANFRHSNGTISTTYQYAVNVMVVDLETWTIINQRDFVGRSSNCSDCDSEIPKSEVIQFFRSLFN